MRSKEISELYHLNIYFYVENSSISLMRSLGNFDGYAKFRNAVSNVLLLGSNFKINWWHAAYHYMMALVFCCAIRQVSEYMWLHNSISRAHNSHESDKNRSSEWKSKGVIGKIIFIWIPYDTLHRFGGKCYSTDENQVLISVTFWQEARLEKWWCVFRGSQL